MPVPAIVPVKSQDRSVHSDSKTYIIPVVNSAGAWYSESKISGYAPPPLYLVPLALALEVVALATAVLVAAAAAASLGRRLLRRCIWRKKK